MAKVELVLEIHVDVQVGLERLAACGCGRGPIDVAEMLLAEQVAMLEPLICGVRGAPEPRGILRGSALVQEPTT